MSRSCLHIPLLILLGAGPVRAQIPPPPPACETGSAMAWLEGRDVRAPVYNTGSLFWRNQGAPQNYTDGAGRNQLLAASLWVGARFESFLFMAGSMLGPWEFWPGPLDEDGLPPVDCEPYDRIAKIDRLDIEEYDRFGTVSENLRDWPWHLGAPLADGDGNPNNYNLEAGDRPAMLGDQMLWWVMNDRAGSHIASQAMPLQIQVEVSAFTYKQPGVLGRSTFYRYRFRRSGLLPFVKAHVGLFVYAGLGNIFDDYIGADSTLDMGYVYNADNLDHGVFGEAPPAVGVGILRGSGPDLTDGDPRALDAREMTSFIGYRSLCPELFPGCSPIQGEGFYNMMRRRWPWGDPVTFSSRSGTLPVPYMFPGDPPDFWSEANLDGSGSMAQPGDRKMVVATGPYTIIPGIETEVVFAIVTSYGSDNFDSVRQLHEDMAFVQLRTAQILTPLRAGKDLRGDTVHKLALSEMWPNPAEGQARIRLSVPQAMQGNISLYDLLGRHMVTVASGLFEEGAHEFAFSTQGLASGIYAWRAQIDRFSRTGTLVVQR